MWYAPHAPGTIVRPLAWLFLALFVLALVEAKLAARYANGAEAGRGGGLPDSLSSLGCGLGQIVTRPLYDAGFALAYLALQGVAHVPAASPRSATVWVVALFATDFLYYVYHRLAHATRLMWAWHGVHHQSERYDYWVSFRLSWLGPPTEKVFYLPLAFSGLPVEAIVAATAYSSFYQFFVHTRAVPRLGPLDWVLNTPSNHRVHHGVEPKYLDKNFAGMFLIWDRLFGTYQPEEEEPTYGVTRAFESKNPLVANVAYFVEWARGLSRIASVPSRGRAPSGSPVVAVYAAGQMAVFCLVTLACFAWAPQGDLASAGAASITVIVAVSSLGLVLDASA